MAGAALPPTVNVLSDSGEKCLVVLYYLASLVEADKTAETDCSMPPGGCDRPSGDFRGLAR